MPSHSRERRVKTVLEASDLASGYQLYLRRELDVVVIDLSMQGLCLARAADTSAICKAINLLRPEVKRHGPANRPPGGGGSDSALNVCRAALSSTPWPDDCTMELDVTRPAGPIVKLRTTVPVAGLADSG